MTKTHGHAGHTGSNKQTPTYMTWNAMTERCRNPNNKAYRYYGGRGIKVCKRWAHFENFLADMGIRPDDMTLDRINNDGNYTPKNCRWANQSEQTANSRTAKPVTWKGVTKLIKGWAKHFGVSSEALSNYARRRNMRVQDAVLLRLRSKP